MTRITVINRAGVEIDYYAAVSRMDEELLWELSWTMESCTEQEFFSAYEDYHERIYDHEWSLSKADPVW